MPADTLSKLKSRDELTEISRKARSGGKTVVFANGCFDLLHVGHIRYLEGARALGDILIVALNSDSSVSVLKGKGRPLQSERERAEIVGSLAAVDYVTIFDESTVDSILRALEPDIHAKGTDYTADTVPERATVSTYGGRVEIVGDPKNHSTRDLIARILSKSVP
jgi:rfaE bifunctional protein nucleotidyltransferase chain/domain